MIAKDVKNSSDLMKSNKKQNITTNTVQESINMNNKIISIQPSHSMMLSVLFFVLGMLLVMSVSHS